MEWLLMAQAYILLSTAMLNGESRHAAGPDYFQATCYIEGYTLNGCINARRQGIVSGLFPVDLSDHE